MCILSYSWPSAAHALSLSLLARSPGLVPREHGAVASIKMSKSKGNVISPDDLVRDYGCDSLRLYELFVGPPELDSEWDDRGIDGVYRFITKLWKLVMDHKDDGADQSPAVVKERNRLVYDITTRLENFSLNTVVSGFMEHLNNLSAMAKDKAVDTETMKVFVQLLAPFAPHISEELYHVLGNEESVFAGGWPAYDEKLMEDDTIEIAVQVNGKLRATINIAKDATKEAALADAKEALGAKLSGNVVKEIYVPGKIVNFVVK